MTLQIPSLNGFLTSHQGMRVQVGQFCIAGPCALAAAFVFHWGVVGMLGGLTLGTVMQTACYLILLARVIDWDLLAAKVAAEHQAEAQTKDERGPARLRRQKAENQAPHRPHRHLPQHAQLCSLQALLVIAGLPPELWMCVLQKSSLVIPQLGQARFSACQ